MTNFTDRVMVSLTLMLVIATITAAIQLTLPATPYFKLIDVWLFFSMNLMVLSLVFHTYLEHVVDRERRGQQHVTPDPQVKSIWTTPVNGGTVSRPVTATRPASRLSTLGRLQQRVDREDGAGDR